VTAFADPADIARLKADSRVWAVVGLGANPERAAYGVALTLQQRFGKRIVPVYPRAEEVHGERGYRTLAEAAAAVGHIDVVDCFVNSGRVGAVVDEAIAIGAGAVWLQLDVIDEAAAQRARDAGLTVVMDRCPAIEFPRLP
jgi:predicted CoA-binding protein